MKHVKLFENTAAREKVNLKRKAIKAGYEIAITN